MSDARSAIRLAISTCPNDTFAFHAILQKKIDLGGLDLQIQLLDIQQLNDGLQCNRFDVAKTSFHAAIGMADDILVLPSGSALGFGVGPLLLSSTANARPDRAPKNRTTTTLCPGELTTATLLFKLFYPAALELGQTRIEHAVFSDIMPALKSHDAEFGVCIHEGRFTWEQEGLYLVEDLGSRWERETAAPLPLGGIIVRRGLADNTIATIQAIIRNSIEYGLANREETLPTMRRYAQEFSDDVLMQHVELYVNKWTVDLGEVGRQALDVLTLKARDCGLVDEDCQGLKVWRA